jgi:hypothetical protein
MTRILNFLWNALFLLSTTPLWATEAPLIFQRAEGQRQPRPEEISYVRDSTQSLGWEDIQKPEYQEKFALIPTKTPNFNFTLDTIWLRLKIASADPVATKRYLSVSYAVLDRVEFFHVDAQGQLKAHFVTGDTLPVKSRAVRDASFVFPVLQEPQEVSTIYLKVQSRGSVNIPLTLWNEEEYYAARQHRFSLQSVYIGAIAAMFLYNLILSLTTRQKTYFFYIGYIFMYFLFISIMNGYFPLMLDNLIPDMPHIAFVLDHLLLVAITANNLFSLLFTFSFLHLSKAHNPISYRIILGFIGIAVLFTLLAHVLPFAPTIAFSAAFSSLTCVVMLGVGIACLLGGYQEARYYVAAWLVYNLGGIIYGLVLAGLSPQPNSRAMLSKLGSCLRLSSSPSLSQIA